MIRLVTLNGERTKPILITKKSEFILDPQEQLDFYCDECFKIRAQYLSSVLNSKPFDLTRAENIMNIMLEKGLSDPKAYSLGDIIRQNWHRFIEIA